MLTVLAFVSKWVGTGRLWLNIAQWLWVRIGWLKTDLGRLCLLIVGLSLIALDRYRREKPKPHNLKTLRGRTLKLRDDLQEFLRDVGEAQRVIKLPSETDEEHIKRGLEVAMPRMWKITHGYELRFASDVLRTYHEFGERGESNMRLGALIDRPHRAEKEIDEIITELSKLADLPIAADRAA